MVKAMWPRLEGATCSPLAEVLIMTMALTQRRRIWAMPSLGSEYAKRFGIELELGLGLGLVLGLGLGLGPGLGLGLGVRSGVGLRRGHECTD